MSNGKHSKANYCITIITSGITLSFEDTVLLFTKKQALSIITYLCIDYSVNLSNGTSWPLKKDGHKHRAVRWTDTTRNIYVPPLHSSGKLVVHGSYRCGTVMRDTYNNIVLPQIEERKYLPCDFEITWQKRHTKKELSQFNETVQKMYYHNRTERNRYLDVKARLLQQFT